MKFSLLLCRPSIAKIRKRILAMIKIKLNGLMVAVYR